MWRRAIMQSFRRKQEGTIEYGEDILAFLKSYRNYHALRSTYSQHQPQKDIVEMTAKRVGFKLPLIEHLEEDGSSPTDDTERFRPHR
jgi:hypothetical protein